MKTEHSIDWSKTMSEIEDQYERMAIERERCVLALFQIRDELNGSNWVIDSIIKRALRGGK